MMEVFGKAFLIFLFFLIFLYNVYPYLGGRKYTLRG